MKGANEVREGGGKQIGSVGFTQSVEPAFPMREVSASCVHNQFYVDVKYRHWRHFDTKNILVGYNIHYDVRLEAINESDYR